MVSGVGFSSCYRRAVPFVPRKTLPLSLSNYRIPLVLARQGKTGDKLKSRTISLFCVAIVAYLLAFSHLALATLSLLLCAVSLLYLSIGLYRPLWRTLLHSYFKTGENTFKSIIYTVSSVTSNTNLISKRYK